MCADCQYNCKSSVSRKPRRFNRHLESVAGGDPGTVLKQGAGPFPLPFAWLSHSSPKPQFWGNNPRKSLLGSP